MKIKYLIPVLILLMLLSVAPVHAIAPLNVTDDILPSSLIINASEQDRCYGLYGTDIDWNGGDVDVNLLEMYIQTSSEPNVVNITFYYDSASVNGNITTSFLDLIVHTEFSISALDQIQMDGSDIKPRHFMPLIMEEMT